jgi:AmmeMemoRadiSam system protein B/AmmeMemoRadiSam system protein A
MEHTTRVRKPAVAGSFYPRNPQALRRDIESYLAAVPAAAIEGRPLVLIEPHAGYMYSGPVAAHGYKLVGGRGIRTVAVISPSHMEHFPFASVYAGESYETPLGRIAIDRRTAEAISAAAPDSIRISQHGHIHAGSYRQEHALEVQLPFLQTVLGEFTLVPIVMGDQSWELCAALGEALRPHAAREDFLIVASTDLSHFHDDHTAESLDRVFCDLAARLDARALYDAIRRDECEACGAGPVIASLLACAGAGTISCRVLHRATSGDVTGERGSVVGYAAAVVQTLDAGKDKGMAEKENIGADLTVAEESFLLHLARRSVEASAGRSGEPPADLTTATLLEKRGAFVTLKIGGRLRGCIGMVEPRKPLKDTVAEMARAAAVGDPRFVPVDEKEIASLCIEISVLTPLRRIRSFDEVVVGTHGLVVERGPHRGLLLPQVATEAGWDRETFLGFTCEKAGLPRNAWRDSDTKIFVFSAQVFGEKD